MSLSEESKQLVREFELYLEVERNFSKHTLRAYSSDCLSFLIWLNCSSVGEVTNQKFKEFN